MSDNKYTMFIRFISLLILSAITSDVGLGAPTPQNENMTECQLLSQNVDKKYPLTDPKLLPDGSLNYRIAIVSDLDAGSVSHSKPNTFVSYFKKGHLIYNAATKNITIEWNNGTKGHHFISNLAVNGRGLELSELVTFNGKLITIDDKTGLAYIIENNVLIPWVIITEGDGHQEKGMKNEWATVKGSKLYVGSHGKEMVSRDGLQVVSRMNMWVKVIDKTGGITHLNWTENFLKIRAAFGIYFPGYMTHESCVWSDVHGRWFFLPRKASLEPFDLMKDEQRATNVLLAASEDFQDIKVTRIGEIVPNHGYASFKFIPGTNDTVITAIKTVEEGDTTATYITAFTTEGEILYPETKVSDLKFEGFDFI